MRRKIRSRIGFLREQAGLTQVQLAAFIGVTPNTIQNWEKEDGLDQLERYLKLAEILGCEVSELVEFMSISELDDTSVIGFSLDDLRNLRAKWNLKPPETSPAENRARIEKEHEPVSSGRKKAQNKSFG